MFDAKGSVMLMTMLYRDVKVSGEVTVPGSYSSAGSFVEVNSTGYPGSHEVTVLGSFSSAGSFVEVKLYLCPHHKVTHVMIIGVAFRRR